MSFVNPKVSPGHDPVDSWYRYYAGYSASFVNQALTKVASSAESILDPWNGTGTSTVVAASRRIRGLGFDINPAMVVVSRARLLDRGVGGSIKALTDDIIAHASPIEIKDDPLHFWFTRGSSAALRGLQASVHRLLVDSSASPYPIISSVKGMSTLAAFFYTVLFRTLRLLIQPAAGSNPTWWKRLEGNKRLRPRQNSITESFRSSAIELAEGLHRTNFDVSVDSIVNVGDSRKLPIGDNSIDAVISSPPYCTRIDYGVSTLPELSILGATEQEVKALRDLMVGTPTMTNEVGQHQLWGPLAADFLGKVSSHESRASKSYYLKYYSQYYSGMWDSLAELRRVTKPGGSVVLVVQDSNYKEIHNDTPGILMEMGRLNGFENTKRHDFSVLRNRASMNPGTKKYRSEGNVKAIESVIVMQ